MSNDTKGKINGFITDNIVVFVMSIVLGAIGLMNKQQLEVIKLGQDKAFLQQASDSDAKYVTKAWFTQTQTETKATEAVNAAAVVQVSHDVGEIKTSVAILAAQLHGNTQ